MDESIYDLELHTSMQCDDDLYATKVPGGWIYSFNHCQTGDATAAVFVPYPMGYRNADELPSG